MGFNVDMFSQPVDASSKEKKLTYLQFIKSAKKAELKKDYQVSIVWVPGEWDNFTLETEFFRLRVPKTSPMYSALKEFVGDSATVHIEMRIQPVEGNPKEYFINPYPGSKGAWTELSDLGYKWQP